MSTMIPIWQGLLGMFLGNFIGFAWGFWAGHHAGRGDPPTWERFVRRLGR